MTEADILHIGGQALTVAAKLSAPLLIATLVIGVVVSLFQAVFQVQDQTLAFVPKLLVAAVVLALGGGWMLQTIVSFTESLFTSIPDLVK